MLKGYEVFLQEEMEVSVPQCNHTRGKCSKETCPHIKETWYRNVLRRGQVFIEIAVNTDLGIGQLGVYKEGGLKGQRDLLFRTFNF